jgi:hypothetical protein
MTARVFCSGQRSLDVVEEPNSSVTVVAYPVTVAIGPAQTWLVQNWKLAMRGVLQVPSNPMSFPPWDEI